MPPKRNLADWVLALLGVGVAFFGLGSTFQVWPVIATGMILLVAGVVTIVVWTRRHYR